MLEISKYYPELITLMGDKLTSFPKGTWPMAERTQCCLLLTNHGAGAGAAKRQSTCLAPALTERARKEGATLL